MMKESLNLRKNNGSKEKRNIGMSIHRTRCLSRLHLVRGIVEGHAGKHL